MDWWLASFFLGAILSLFLPVVPEFSVLFLLLLFSITLFYCPFNLNKRWRSNSGLLFGASWLLFNAYNFQQLWQENNLNAVELSAKSQWVQGQVLSLTSPPKQNNNTLTQIPSVDKRLRFNFKVTHVNQYKLSKAILLRLSWKNASLPLLQGQIALLNVKFKPAHGLANLGGFSYQTWLNSSEISATGYVINHRKNQVLSSKKTMRQELFSAYRKLIPNHDLAPLLLALGFGSRSELNQDIWQVLQATGTGHLIAISGLHIGLVATASYFLITFFIRALPLSLFSTSHHFQTYNARYVAIGLSMMTAFSYGYLAGFSLPTSRALMMLSLFWLIRLLAIHLSLKRWFLLTLFLLTLMTPFSLFTASFWLSVYAVAIIFLTLWRFKNTLSSGTKGWRFIKGLLVIQFSLTLMLLPVSAVFFQQVSLCALFANLVAVPWMSFISIPLCLLSVLVMPMSDTLSQFFIMLCLASLEWLWHYLHYLSSVTWAMSGLSSQGVQLLVFVGLFSFLWLFFQPKITLNFKHTAVLSSCMVILISVLGLSKQSDRQSKNWRLVVFDVGQGLSVLIQRQSQDQSRAILYDTGASYASGFNMVESVVLPYLQYAGIKQLDKVVISHSDNDHAGGLAYLQQSIEIKELLYNRSIDEKGVSSSCVQGKSFYWQELTFEVLWPEKAVAKENDNSCVLLMSDGIHKVLLAGDISKKIENKLINQYPELSVDVLVVPHHGSKTSSSAAFITQLKPKFGLVSAGFLNRWNMPVVEVVKRYQSNNVQLFNSAKSGQIIINFSSKGIVKQTYHDDLWPFWFAK